MKPEQQRIAIAEFAGFQWYRIPHSEKHSRGPLRALFLPAAHEIDQDPIWLVKADGSERIANMEYMASDGHVPDYPNDLNAMHDAEQALSEQDQNRYTSRLIFMLIGPDNQNLVVWEALTATAAQRAEALLRTIGKWKD